MAGGSKRPTGSSDGCSNPPFLIGVTGGTASGKSTVCHRIMEMLGQNNVAEHQRKVVCISQDSFYKELTDSGNKSKAIKGLYNFDHPDAFDEKALFEVLVDIQHGKPCRIPVYDYVNNCRKENEFQVIHNADVVLVEGILVFYFREIRDLFDMKLFVDTDADTRLSRRVLRDTQDRGRDLRVVLNQYVSLVKPAFEEFCLPTKKHADVIIPRGAENVVAIDLILKHIQEILTARTEGRRVSMGAVNRSRHHSDSLYKPTVH